MARLRSSRVVMIGLGAVGSYCAEALVRAGIGSLRLVDFDVIRPTNINRHLWALESTVGRPKVSVGMERLLGINPKAAIEALQVFCDETTMTPITDNRPHLVLDAIDSLNPKVQALTFCARKKIPVFSSMGAATRTDPLAIRIGDVFETKNCPLAERLRRRLRKNGIEKGFIRCVFSTQHQDVGRLSGEAGKDSGEYARGRARRPLGSLPTLTGIFGLVLAQMAIDFLMQHDEG